MVKYGLINDILTNDCENIFSKLLFHYGSFTFSIVTLK